MAFKGNASLSKDKGVKYTSKNMNLDNWENPMTIKLIYQNYGKMDLWFIYSGFKYITTRQGVSSHFLREVLASWIETDRWSI